jgi:molybdate transport system substrate-binding protein
MALVGIASPGMALPRPPSIAAPRATLMVFAAASLSESFREIGRELERRTPGLEVKFNLAGSQQLAAQIEQGASADVFASADERWMSYVQQRGLVEEPRLFARNRLVVIVPAKNPGRIRGLSDLARRGIKIAIGAEAVPVGRYSREVLRKLGGEAGFPAGYARRVLANVVTEEENVRSVVGKVQLGEVDAGICYRSDVGRELRRFVRTIEIPERANMLASYPIARVKPRPGEDPTAPHARAFADLVLSTTGQEILERHGLIAAARTP